MFKHKWIAKITTFIFITSSISLIFQCAARKPMWGDEESGFILSYRPLESWHYLAENEESTVIEIMGQEQETVVTSLNEYTMTLESKSADTLNMKVDIDSMSRNISGPQGTFDPDFSDVLGKEFQLLLTPLGHEEVEGIDDLVVDMGPQGGGEQSLRNYYRNLLPDLAEEPVKINDTWTVTDEYSAPVGNMDLTIATTTTHTLLGLEVVDEIECLKISAEVEGTVSGSGVQGMNEFDINSELKGNQTWFFDYQNGTYVKGDGGVDLVGTIDVKGDYTFSMPITQTTSAKVRLLGAQ